MIYVPDRGKNKEMCDKAVKKVLWLIKCIPNQFIAQEVCKKAIAWNFDDKKNLFTLEQVPDIFRGQIMCNEVRKKNAWVLEFVPNIFNISVMNNKDISGYIPKKRY